MGKNQDGGAMRIRLFGRVLYMPPPLVASMVLIIILALAVIGYNLSRGDRDTFTYHTPTPPLIETGIQSTDPPMISVHVIGCVKEKKVVKIPVGSTVEDAVIAAGGFTEDADTDSVNLAYRLSDGMQIKIPSVNDEDKTWLISHGETGGGGNNNGKISINKASVSELATLPGIGQALAQRIVEYREKNGGFKSIEEIMNVPGIKEAKFESIKDYITL